jgi:TRAP-type transport system small permease protein
MGRSNGIFLIIRILNKIALKINNICSIICIILTAILIIIIPIQVIFRYIFNHALSWPEELAGFCFVWLTMIGATVCLFKRSHVGVSLLVSKLPESFQRTLAVISYIIISIYSYLLITQGYLIIEIVSRQLSPILRINMSWMYSPILVVGIISLYYCLVIILNIIYLGIENIKIINLKEV